jgi:hypothetical protein
LKRWWPAAAIRPPQTTKPAVQRLTRLVFNAFIQALQSPADIGYPEQNVAEQSTVCGARLAIHLPLTKVLGSLMVVPCAFIGPVGKETPHNDGVMEDLSLKHAQSPVLPSTRFATDGLETTALMREGWPRQLAWWPIPLLLLTIAALWAAKELP